MAAHLPSRSSRRWPSISAPASGPMPRWWRCSTIPASAAFSPHRRAAHPASALTRGEVGHTAGRAPDASGSCRPNPAGSRNAPPCQAARTHWRKVSTDWPRPRARSARLTARLCTSSTWPDIGGHRGAHAADAGEHRARAIGRLIHGHGDVAAGMALPHGGFRHFAGQDVHVADGLGDQVHPLDVPRLAPWMLLISSVTWAVARAVCSAKAIDLAGDRPRSRAPCRRRGPPRWWR